MKKMFLFYRALLFPIGKLLFPCKVMDKDKYKKYGHGQLIISNHLSWMDISYQVFSIPGYKRFLSKKENDGGKIQKWFLHNIGVIFVNREKPELSSMRECVGALSKGETLSVFPEGTRNRINREIMEMHSGAALFALKGEASVVPVVVHHKGKLFKRNYIGVGDPVMLDDLYGKRVDGAVLDEATQRFRKSMEATLEKLDKWVDEKGYKTERRAVKQRKRAKKLEAKRLNKQYKLAMRDHVKGTHSK